MEAILLSGNNSLLPKFFLFLEFISLSGNHSWCWSPFVLRGDTHMTSTLGGGRGGLRQKWDVIGRRGIGGLVSILDVKFVFVFVKENWICAMSRHHAEANINKKSSFLLWRHTAKSFFNYTIALHCTLFDIRTIPSEQKPWFWQKN